MMFSFTNIVACIISIVAVTQFLCCSLRGPQPAKYAGILLAIGLALSFIACFLLLFPGKPCQEVTSYCINSCNRLSARFSASSWSTKPYVQLISSPCSSSQSCCAPESVHPTLVPPRLCCLCLLCLCICISSQPATPPPPQPTGTDSTTLQARSAARFLSTVMTASATAHGAGGTATPTPQTVPRSGALTWMVTVTTRTMTMTGTGVSVRRIVV